MRATRQSDTAAETALRSELWRSGLRGYRVNVRPLPDFRRTADVLFRRQRVAIFVDGCFWHSCPEHGSQPKANNEWWESKLRTNSERDADTNRRLEEAGWTVIRVWEHERPRAAAATIRRILDEEAGRAEG